MPQYYSVSQAAELLKVTRQRVLQLINKGRIEAEKIGSYWIVKNLVVSPAVSPAVRTQKNTKPE